MITFELKAIARAMATAWRWPPESLSTSKRTGNLDLETVEQTVCVLLHALVVHDMERTNACAHRFAPEEYVGGNVKVVGKSQVLIDHLDAQAARIQRTGHVRLVSLDEDLAFIRDIGSAEDFHQSRFAGSVVAHQSKNFAVVQRQVHTT